tara:strand:+ start:18389 stop:18568 length:180 start_codon:yes stop_codon:yes gene_type:complete
MSDTYIEANKGILNKRVNVESKYGNWTGVVKKIKNRDTFLVEDDETGKTREADIFEIRQ